ncbi:MAG: hypothetical protein ACREJX_01340, partial [Polyangiaceae bacterium]
MRRARVLLALSAVALYACSLADGGFLTSEPADGSVVDASISDSAPGDETIDFDDATLDAAACPSGCPSGFSCLDGTCADVAARAFSTSANPSGNWLYLHLMLDAEAVPYPSLWAFDDSGVVMWSPAVGTGTPFVGENLTGALAHPFGTTSFPPHALAAHPDSDGSWSVVRWTAPQSATYSLHLHATGFSYDAHPTSTDVAVFQNGTRQEVGYVNVDGGGNDAVFAPIVATLASGDTFEVRVGYGNGDYTFDSTGLD